MITRRLLLGVLCAASTATICAQIQTNAGVQYLQCMPKDMSTDFSDLSNTYFLADSLASFDAAKGEGLVEWDRYRLSPRQAFNLNGYWPVRMQMLDFPDAAYDNDPRLRLQIEFVSPRTVRIRMLTTPIVPKDDADDPMFAPAFKSRKAAASWPSTVSSNAIVYKSPFGTVEVQRYPFRLVLRDAQGRILTQSRHVRDNDSTQVKLLPFSFIKRGADNSRSVNPVFLLSPSMAAANRSPHSTRWVRRCTSLSPTRKDWRPTACTNLCPSISPTAATASSCTPLHPSLPTSAHRTSVHSGCSWQMSR